MNITTQDFQSLFEASSKAIQPNSLVKGTIVKIIKDYVLVDIGYKSEGQIPIDQFKDFDGELTIKEGDVVDVFFESVEDDNGRILLSKEKADALAVWDNLAAAELNGTPIEGVVINKTKGGMSVNIGGIKAFLPGSQIDLKPIKALDKLIGKKFRFQVLKTNRLKGNVVVSRRAILEKEREEAKKELLSHLQEGQVVEGIVKNITDYGAFIDLGGIDGLLHITDISWGRVNHPSEVLEMGQQINVLVTKFDQENQKVSLGYKQLVSDPWETVQNEFVPGTKVKGKVVNITDYGAFIELRSGVEGLVHVSEMSWQKKSKHPSKIVNLGDLVEAVVLDIDVANRRISLGMKQIEPNPWIELEEKYPIGTRIKGEIRNITDFGVFVAIDEGIDGLVHVSDISWTKKVKNPADLYQKGQIIEAVVLNIDKENERFSLGIRQLEEDPFPKIAEAHPIGSWCQVTIKAVESFGAITELSSGAEALIPSKEFDRAAPKVGDVVDTIVIGQDEAARRVTLSIRQYLKESHKKDFEMFRAKQGEVRTTLSDLLNSK